ncbi:hypothetical protein [Pseudoalteromonas sp. OOF1S-7]|uniref:hypothetical protein n=1 Tax=Pseudoalteromonas sp. OOF1S-7 TaxID=2917757 RepID=UPI001EF4025C|nr:hypothetical protein [Pseudoalteromonas sp. OOF1S-7]MCG7535596.1 hypothetical protein [Pseudoalteromonas sp. OOF1S-7]
MDDVESLALSFGDAPALVMSSRGTTATSSTKQHRPIAIWQDFALVWMASKALMARQKPMVWPSTRDYPEGLLVLQEGRNRFPDQPQNFKFVSWRDVLEATGINQGLK